MPPEVPFSSWGQAILRAGFFTILASGLAGFDMDDGLRAWELRFYFLAQMIASLMRRLSVPGQTFANGPHPRLLPVLFSGVLGVR
jgi:hypothetical protein